MKKYADGGQTNPVPPQKRPPAPQTDKELDEISPEAQAMMEQKRKDVKQEEQQKNMEKSAKRYASGGKVGSASKRADRCAVKGKTRGRMV